MRKLSEAEQVARGIALNVFAKDKGIRITVQENKSFNAGFIAGLEYAQKRIDELEAALRQTLKVAHQAIETTKAVADDMSRVSNIY